MDAVKTWSTAQRNRNDRLHDKAPVHVEATDPTGRDPSNTGPGSPVPKTEPTVVNIVELSEVPHRGIEWWTTATRIPLTLQVGTFIGQGRRIQFCGIPHAFLKATRKAEFSEANPTELDRYAMAIAEELRGGKPRAWYVVAVTSFFLVWTAIMSGFIVCFTVSDAL